ncbi:MAG TPA: ABATE domain-containing protein [Candidatus Dormibacteraeota bacterium]
MGGRLCLDFCNTTDNGRRGPEDRLESYGDLVRWGWRAGILTPEEAARLARLGASSPADASMVRKRAVRLRDALTSIFSSVAEGRGLRPGALDVLNHELSGPMSRSRVVPADRGFTWLWTEGGGALDCVLWPIARSGADLLTEGPLNAIRVCEGRGCGWLFLDASRNRTRRWCDMRICGNRAKARRHHERTKAGAA